jgi:hypothetical protein
MHAPFHRLFQPKSNHSRRRAEIIDLDGRPALVPGKKTVHDMLPDLAKTIHARPNRHMCHLIGRRLQEYFKISRADHSDVDSLPDRLRRWIIKTKRFHEGLSDWSDGREANDIRIHRCDLTIPKSLFPQLSGWANGG